MEVYIEDAIFDTTIINLAILYLSMYSLRQKFNFFKAIFSALFGCLISVALTFFVLSQWIVIILKILCGIIMCTIVLPKFSIKLLSLFFLIFLSFTCLLGGFCFFVIYLFGGEVYSLETMGHNLPISLGCLTLLLWLYVIFLIKIIKIFYKKQKMEKFYYDVKICANGKILKLKAYLDSGNLLQDPQTNLPVLILNLKSFLRLFNGKINIVDYLNGKLPLKLNGKYIEFCSIGKTEKIFAFLPEKVEVVGEKGIQDKKIDVLIGVSANNFSSSNFDALLSPLSV